MFRLSHNACVDRIRAHHEQEVSITHEVENYSDPKNISDKNALDTDYKKLLVQTYLSTLDEKYRSVLYLVYYENKSYDEIAAIQQSNKNSIGTLAFQ
ncbi:MAG: sigma factor-like helix-turn-helix DNA-binding protein [bacterium]